MAWARGDEDIEAEAAARDVAEVIALARVWLRAQFKDPGR
jgi:hypothetical protein